jgi:hypothetical protein
VQIPFMDDTAAKALDLKNEGELLLQM